MYFAVLNTINQGLRYVLGFLLFAMCLFALLQVTVRLFLNEIGFAVAVPWSEEVGRYAMIWMIFLGAAYAFGSGQMVSLQLLIGKLPLRWRTAADLVSIIVVVGFALLLVKVGLQATEFGWIEKSPVLQIDKALVYLAMPVSAALIVLNAGTRFFQAFLKRHCADPTDIMTPNDKAGS